MFKLRDLQAQTNENLYSIQFRINATTRLPRLNESGKVILSTRRANTIGQFAFANRSFLSLCSGKPPILERDQPFQEMQALRRPSSRQSGKAKLRGGPEDLTFVLEEDQRTDRYNKLPEKARVCTQPSTDGA